MKERLVSARDSSQRYLLIKRNVSYTEQQRIAQFPIFSRGQYGGGFISERRAVRNKPFGGLTSRTIGSARARH